MTRPEIGRRELRARTHCLHAVVVAALLAGGGVQVPTGQGRPADQTPPFRVRTDLVQLDVSVLDQQGLPVRGLGPTDFTVFEDGVPQAAVAFASVDVPTWSVGAAAAWMREVGPDVVSNRLDARRAVVIVLDDYKTRWDPGVTRVAKAIAGATIDGLGPADLAAVVYVVSRDRGQEFTVDRTRLRAAVERFAPSGFASPSENRFSASAPSDGRRTPQTSAPSGACMQDCIATALRNVAEILDSWPGARKTVVLISPGHQPSGVAEHLSESDERGRMFAALKVANVNVYQFDPHGLQTGPQPFSDFGTFAENTGGRATTNTNAPADFVPQMFRENSSYYLLGFRPANGSRDGRFHRLKVQVNRPGLHVRARAGYYAPTDRPPTASMRPTSAVDRALSGGLPAGDLPVSLTVAPFATAGKPGAVLAVVVRLDHEADLASGTVVEFAAVAFNDKWKQVAAITQRFMPAPANDRVRFPETAARLNLPPSRYEIRAAMRSTADDRTGSVYASVTVPNFAREPLSLSGLVIERQSGGAAMLEDLATVVPARMTTDRVFSAGERVAVVARVYQGRVKTPVPVRITARIADAQDRIASTTETTVEPTAFGAERQADYRLDLPLDRLAAGEYLLTVDLSTATTSARRDLRFTVRR